MSDVFQKFLNGEDRLSAVLRALPAFEPSPALAAAVLHAAQQEETRLQALNPAAVETPAALPVFEAPASLQEAILREAQALDAAQAPRRAAVLQELTYQTASETLGAPVSEQTEAWLRAQNVPPLASHQQHRDQKPAKSWRQRWSLAIAFCGALFAGVGVHQLYQHQQRASEEQLTLSQVPAQESTPPMPSSTPAKKKTPMVPVAPTTSPSRDAAAQAPVQPATVSAPPPPAASPAPAEAKPSSPAPDYHQYSNAPKAETKSSPPVAAETVAAARLHQKTDRANVSDHSETLAQPSATSADVSDTRLSARVREAATQPSVNATDTLATADMAKKEVAPTATVASEPAAAPAIVPAKPAVPPMILAEAPQAASAMQKQTSPAPQKEIHEAESEKLRLAKPAAVNSPKPSPVQSGARADDLSEARRRTQEVAVEAAEAKVTDAERSNVATNHRANTVVTAATPQVSTGAATGSSASSQLESASRPEPSADQKIASFTRDIHDNWSPIFEKMLQSGISRIVIYSRVIDDAETVAFANQWRSRLQRMETLEIKQDTALLPRTLRIEFFKPL